MFALISITGDLLLNSGLHIGTSSILDNPANKSTAKKIDNTPYIPATTLKGKLRHIATNMLDDTQILRLFGTDGKRGQLLFLDSLINGELELKYENCIDRESLESNPRVIERVAKDGTATLNLNYQVKKLDDVRTDLNKIKEILSVLQYENIGAKCTTGYGVVSVSNIRFETLVGDADGLLDDLIDEINL